MTYLRRLAALGNLFLLLLVPLACSTALHDAVIAPKQAMLWIGASLLLSGTALLSYIRGDFKWASYPLLSWSAVFYGWTVICALVNGLHIYALVGFITALIYIAILWAWPRALEGENLWKYAGLVSIAGFIMGLYAHLQRLTLANITILGISLADPMDWQPIHLARERTIATMGNPNYFAAYLVAVLPLALSWVLTRPKRAARYVGLVLWTLSALAMLLTQTRAAWLGFLGSALVWLYMAWRSDDAPQRRTLITTVAVLAAALLLGMGATAYWQKLNQVEFNLVNRVEKFADKNDLSIQARLYFWRSALRSGLESPIFGFGPGGQEHNSYYHRDLEPMPLRFPPRCQENVHSQYLQNLAELGWPGFLLQLGLIGYFGWTLCRRRDMLSAGLLGSGTALWITQIFICSTCPTETLWLLLLTMAALTCPTATCQGATSETSDLSEANPQTCQSRMSGPETALSAKPADTDGDGSSPGSASSDIPSDACHDLTSSEAVVPDLTSAVSTPAQTTKHATVAFEYDDFDWHSIYLPCLVALVFIGCVSIAAVLSLYCEYDLCKASNYQGYSEEAANQLPKSASAMRQALDRSQRYYLAALEIAPLWREWYIYRCLGEVNEMKYAYLDRQNKDLSWDYATEYYGFSLESNPFEPHTYCRLANIQKEEKGWLPVALETIDMGLALDPRNPQYRNLKGRILIDMGRFEEADKLLQESIEICPLSPQLWHSITALHRLMGRLDLAAKDLDNFQLLAPKAQEAVNDLKRIEPLTPEQKAQRIKEALEPPPLPEALREQLEKANAASAPASPSSPSAKE